MESLINIYFAVGILLCILMGLLIIALAVKGVEWLTTQSLEYEEEIEKEIIRKYEQNKK